MAIERQYGKVIFICDECSDEFDTDTKNFDEALQILKDEDEWLITKEGEEWIHICPDCI